MFIKSTDSFSRRAFLTVVAALFSLPSFAQTSVLPGTRVRPRADCVVVPQSRVFATASRRGVHGSRALSPVAVQLPRRSSTTRRVGGSPGVMPVHNCPAATTWLSIAGNRTIPVAHNPVIRTPSSLHCEFPESLSVDDLTVQTKCLNRRARNVAGAPCGLHFRWSPARARGCGRAFSIRNPTNPTEDRAPRPVRLEVPGRLVESVHESCLPGDHYRRYLR